LVDKGSFTEGDCFPFKDGDTLGSVREFRVGSLQWKGGRRPSLDRLRKKCRMVDWGRGEVEGEEGGGHLVSTRSSLPSTLSSSLVLAMTHISIRGTTFQAAERSIPEGAGSC
jgi:hypothetical protein